MSLLGSGIIAAADGGFLNDEIDSESFTVTSANPDPGPSSASFSVENDGSLTFNGNVSDPLDTEWLAAAGDAADYEVKVENTSGSVDSGTTGSFISCGTSRTWTESATTVGTDSCEVEVTIRHATRTNESITFSVSLSAEVAI